jgi:hypothetical protein
MASRSSASTRETIAAARSWHLGINPLSLRCLALLALVAVITVPSYGAAGLVVHWTSAWAVVLILGSVLGFWAYFYAAPGPGPRDWIIAECAFALALLFALTQLLLPAQYLAVALNNPLIDPLLARADAAMGVHLPSIVEWTRQYPQLTEWLVWGYGTFTWQLSLLPILLVLLNDREALWEYVFHFYFCATVILPIFALWPAACAFTYMGFQSILDQSQFIEHFAGVRAGTFRELTFGHMTGLVSMPSFHVAGAVMIVWALRRHRLWWLVVVPVNGLLIASTVLTGAHYLVDLFGTMLLFGASLFAFKRYGLRWIAFVRHRSPRTEPEAAAA